MLCWQHCNAASPSRAVQIMTPKSKLALTPGSEILLLLVLFSSISSLRIVVSSAFVCVSGRRMRRLRGWCVFVCVCVGRSGGSVWIGVVGGVEGLRCKSGFDPLLKGLFVLQLTTPGLNLALSCPLSLSTPSSPPSSRPPDIPQSYHPLTDSHKPPIPHNPHRLPPTFTPTCTTPLLPVRSAITHRHHHYHHPLVFHHISLSYSFFLFAEPVAGSLPMTSSRHLTVLHHTVQWWGSGGERGRREDNSESVCSTG